MKAEGEIRVPIASGMDIVPARAEGRALANRLGFSKTDATLIATAISEIARNIVMHVGKGEIEIKPVDEGSRCGVAVIARDEGPGIGDVAAAMEPGYGSKDGLGLGLPGAKRLMDDFEIDSKAGGGTTITMTKWRARTDLERLRDQRNGGDRA
jgi:serine/threonine-protein kinase RsbT